MQCFPQLFVYAFVYLLRKFAEIENSKMIFTALDNKGAKKHSLSVFYNQSIKKEAIMKTKSVLTFTVGFLLAFVCGNLSAQNTSTAGKNNISNEAQHVSNAAITNPDVLVITGKMLDATNRKPIAGAKINFEKFGDELLQASIDEEGNYALAMNKKELGEPIRVIFKIEGYKRYTIKSIDKSRTYIDADIFLQPLESEEKSTADIKYTLSDDPFNVMVIKMQ